MSSRAASAPRRQLASWRALLWYAVLLATFVFSTASQAHGKLKASTPASGAHITAPPVTIDLVFTEAPSLALSSVRLAGPNGESVALGPLGMKEGSRFAVSSRIDGALTSGVYTVQWQMAGDDGHPTTGSFRFTLALPSSVADSSMPAGETHENPISQPDAMQFGVESPAYVAIRWLQYGALLVIIGVVAFALFVIPRLRHDSGAHEFPDMYSRASQVGLIATLLLGASALMRLFAQSYALHGVTLMPDLALLGTLLRVTQWGRAWVLELLAIVIALVVFATAPGRHAKAWLILATSAAAMAFAMALSGHAAAAPTLGRLAVFSDTVHILGAGGWLGSLLVLLVVGIPAALRAERSETLQGVATLVTAFSPTALVFAGMTALTGLFATWLHVSSLPALWETRYGQVLLLKLAVLSVTAGIGFYNWRRVQPMLSTSAAATVRLRRSATAELAIGLLVILLTAVLVATPTGMDM